ncbi:FimV/HubP family polar landmark protein [Alishewanella tabrizica]|nr:FimV/HubP family polar landmark protein [Alishewanella tabrizica]
MRLSLGLGAVGLLCLAASTCLLAETVGPVKADTTLWRLALEARPDEHVSMPQVIYALWQQNPHAFRQNNLHHLIQGAVLTPPSREQMLATDAATAKTWYYAQLAEQPLPSHAKPTTSTLVSTRRDNGSATAALSPPPATSADINSNKNAMVIAELDTPDADVSPLTTRVSPAVSVAAATALAESTSSRDTHATPQHPTTAKGSWRVQHEFAAEQRYFNRSGMQGAAHFHSLLSYRGQWSYEDVSRRHNVNIEPYLRWHQRDSDSHLVDLQQAYWRYIGTGWEVKAGIDTVFWGVTESQHLVDVINQTDVTAGVELEAKLGQPMLSLRRTGKAGTLDIYVLPYFRERQFPAPAGRLGPPLRVNQDLTWYESSDGKHNLDVALRYSQRFAGMDVGLSFFSGNNREPLLQPTPSGELQSLYYQMEQYGVDLQWVQGEWLWKLESIYRRTGYAEYVAATGGFEYTQIGAFAQVWDLGWIAEYQYDSRGAQATLPGQNDLFLGWRLALNDLAGSDFLVGVLQDLDNKQSRSMKLEGSTRLSDSMRLSVHAWLFQTDDPLDRLFLLKRDDYIALQLSYYF